MTGNPFALLSLPTIVAPKHRWTINRFVRCTNLLCTVFLCIPISQKRTLPNFRECRWDREQTRSSSIPWYLCAHPSKWCQHLAYHDCIHLSKHDFDPGDVVVDDRENNGRMKTCWLLFKRRRWWMEEWPLFSRLFPKVAARGNASRILRSEWCVRNDYGNESIGECVDT